MFLLRLGLVAIVVVSFGYTVMYNKMIIKKLLTYQEKSESIFFRLVGSRLRNLNRKVTRTATLHKNSFSHKVYNFFDAMIINLDMVRDEVSVVGLLTFISSVSLVLALFLVNFIGAWNLFVFAFAAFMFLVIVLLRLMSISRYERRESEIMDALDLMVSDIGDGVYNAISRYRSSFHPNINVYFLEFIDDIQNKGYGFKQAILILNSKLGPNFNEFTQKAIIYEEKADKGMQDIFSSIIDSNRQRRTLRYINDKEFSDLRVQFIVSMVIILGYALMSMVIDSFFVHFFMETLIGRVLIITNIVIVAAVLAYMASIKAESL